MGQYILRRLLLLVLTMLITSAIIFGLTQLLPGDIARINLGRDASPQALEEFRETHGLNDPVPAQYVNWLGGFITGDWGRSFNRGFPAVRPMVTARLENTLRLAAMTLAISIPLSILLGVAAALTEDSWLDSIISVFSLSVVGLPEFVTGIVLINVFAHGLNWFPATSFACQRLQCRRLAAGADAAGGYGDAGTACVCLSHDACRSHRRDEESVCTYRHSERPAPAQSHLQACLAQRPAAHDYGDRPEHRLVDRRPGHHRGGVQLSGPGARTGRGGQGAEYPHHPGDCHVDHLRLCHRQLGR
jgi:hypothetical protein